MGETECFFGHNIARGSGGDDGMNPKPNKKMSLGAESYGIIVCKGFFTQSQVLLSSIVGFKQETMYGFSVRQHEKSGRCREVGVSGGLTVSDKFHLSVLKITFLCQFLLVT